MTTGSAFCRWEPKPRRLADTGIGPNVRWAGGPPGEEVPEQAGPAIEALVTHPVPQHSRAWSLLDHVRGPSPGS